MSADRHCVTAALRSLIAERDALDVAIAALTAIVPDPPSYCRPDSRRAQRRRQRQAEDYARAADAATKRADEADRWLDTAEGAGGG